MTNRLPLAALFALALLAATPSAQAQTTFELGPRVGYEVDQINGFSLGADLRVSTTQLPFQINGTFDYYFTDDDQVVGGAGNPTVLKFAANGLYEFSFEQNEVFTPYFGPGLSVISVSGDNGDDGDDAGETDVGLNVVGGAEFEAADFGFGTVRPFAQAEFVPLGGDVQPFQITGGLLFRLGGN